jgi:tripartite-type tricarboxylate transporter receptor subunit TctC
VIGRRQVVLAAGALGLARAARADETLTLLVGAAGGSTMDGLARGFAPFLARHLASADLDVRNVPGGAGVAGVTALADAAADGSVLGWVATPMLAARAVDRGAGEVLGRIVLLGAVQKEPIAIVSPAATPLESVQDVIQRSAEDAGAVPLGTPPPGSPPHLAALRLQVLTGTRLNIVAFPSVAAVRQAVLAGNVAAAAVGLSSVIGDLRDTRLVGLGIAAKDRAEGFPDMPPLLDSGIDLAAFIRRGLAAPVGLAPEAIQRLQATMQAVVADAAFRQAAEARGFLANWIDGPTWTAVTEGERAELANLWATEPWLQEGTG